MLHWLLGLGRASVGGVCVQMVVVVRGLGWWCRSVHSLTRLPRTPHSQAKQRRQLIAHVHQPWVASRAPKADCCNDCPWVTQTNVADVLIVHRETE